jgi:hypothetical protein
MNEASVVRSVETVKTGFGGVGFASEHTKRDEY